MFRDFARLDISETDEASRMIPCWTDMIHLHPNIRTKAADALAMGLALSMFSASARGELGGQKFQQPEHETPLVPQAEPGHQGIVQKQGVWIIGGFIGIGGKQVQIPMSDLKLEGDRLVATSLAARSRICSRSPPEKTQTVTPPR